MEQPSSPSAPSYPPNSTLRPRVASRTYSLVHLEDEEATSMPAQIVATLPLKKRPGWPLCCAYLLILVFASVARSFGQTTPHSPGWVVLPVDEYRTLHAKAYPIERDPEPPPVEATLTRVDYELRIDGELASGRASLTVDVLKDGWVRVPVPAGLLVREARLDGKLVSLVPSVRGGKQVDRLWSRKRSAHLCLAQEDRGPSRHAASAHARIADATPRPWRRLNFHQCRSKSRGNARRRARRKNSNPGQSHHQSSSGRNGGRLGCEGQRTLCDVPRTR